jgi:hypothetical protein
LKLSKVVGLIIVAIQLMSAVALIAGMHTMLGVFTSALPSDGQEIDFEYSDPVIIPINLTPVNNGLLSAKMSIKISIIVNGVEVASDSSIVSIPSGSMVPIELRLTIPLNEAQEYFNEENDLQFKADINIKTLFDLISFSNNILIEGGELR